MLSVDGRVVIVYNGEIYNDQDLARALAKQVGFVRRTSCDAEIIPAAYAAWGEEAFARFEGMFAIALWDRQTKTLFLARDGVGIKPLYVHDDGRAISFASELKALLVDPRTPRRFSPPDLAHMLAHGYAPPERTLLEGVRQLAPGSILATSANGTRERRFWQPRRTHEIDNLQSATEEFVNTFSTVVREQLASDVDVGVLQSGGIDSSLVSMALPQARIVPLFSVRFAERSHDESALVDYVARASGRQVTYIDLAPGSDIVADFREVVDAVDGQLSDASALACHRLSEITRRHVKVALSGDGADEFFGGYPTYRATAMASGLRGWMPPRAWRLLARGMRAVARGSDERLSAPEKAYRFFHGLSQATPHATWRHYFPSWMQGKVYGAGLSGSDVGDPFSGYAAAFDEAKGDVIDQALLADQTYYLPADLLVKLDRTSMAHGLEVRVPMLDRRIMEFAGRLDHRLLLDRTGSTKRVLRQALSLMGCGDVVTKAPKRGFNLPINSLLRQELGSLANRFLDREADIFAPYLRPDEVRSLWRSHVAGRSDEKYIVWTLMTLAVWCEKEGIC